MFVCPMDVSLIDSRLGDEQLLVFDFIFSEGVGAVHVQNSGKLYAILLARSAESDLDIISVSSNKVNVCGKSGSFQRVRNESTK